MADATGSGALDAGSLIGQTLAGRYLIQGQLGKGGMAVVYQAKDKSFGRTVAVKVLRTDVAKDPVAAKRLVREARAAGQLHHPNIITMHDVGEANGLVYIVMEVLKGVELSDVMEEHGAVPVDRALEIGRQVASALVVAHQNNIIHRDIKPENLFLVDAGNGRETVKMLDFSIAKLPTNMVTAALTRAGSVFGTPHYMAPEQVEGRQVCHQTDLYALGAVIYELIAGEPPFDGNSVIDILLQHAKAPPPKLVDTGIALPPGLSELVDSMLAKKETDRPASAGEVEQALLRFQEQLRAGNAKAGGAGAATEVIAAVNPDPPTERKIRAPKFTHAAPDFAPPEAPAPTGALSERDKRAIQDANAKKQRAKAAGAPEDMGGAGVEATARSEPAPALDLPADLPEGLELPDAAPAKARAPFGNPSTGDEATLIGAGLAHKVREEAARIERERAEKAAAEKARGQSKGRRPSGKEASASRGPARPPTPGPSRKVKVNVPPPPGGRAELPSVSAPGALRGTGGKLRRAPRSAAEVRRTSSQDADTVSTVDLPADAVPPAAVDDRTRARAAQETLAVTGEQLDALKRKASSPDVHAAAGADAADGHKKILVAAIVIAVIGLAALAGAAILILGQ